MHRRPSRWTLLIEAGHEADTLLRALNLCLVAGAILNAVGMHRTPAGLHIRLELEDLDEQRAETLCDRLRARPDVSSVALGWHELAASAA